MHVEIDTSPRPDLGRTACDVDGVFGRAPNADVGLELDGMRFWDFVLKTLATYR